MRYKKSDEMEKMMVGLFRKGLATGLVLLFIGMVVLPSNASNYSLVEVSPISSITGITHYVGGSGSGNYSRIQDAIDNASDSDTVFVYDDSAPYYENVVVNKSIYLIGEDKNTTIVDGNRTGDVMKITANGVTFSGFTVRNGSYSDYIIEAGGIRLDPSSYTIISNNIILDNDKYGIKVAEKVSSNNTISDNIVMKNGREDYRARAYFNIWLFKSSNNTISDNIIKDAKGFGIGICYWSKNTTVNGNIITDNKMSGIRSRYSYNNKIYGNSIENNEKFGICIMNASANNSIEQNNFIDNEPRDAFFTLTNPSMPNKWNNNYWSRPRVFPKPILGYLRPNVNRLIGFLWLAIDWHPALASY
jgi:parallel beta-helix repeat protein